MSTRPQIAHEGVARARTETNGVPTPEDVSQSVASTLSAEAATGATGDSTADDSTSGERRPTEEGDVDVPTVQPTIVQVSVTARMLPAIVGTSKLVYVQFLSDL